MSKKRIFVQITSKKFFPFPLCDNFWILFVTWHCCGPCRVGDAVFGLCFFGVIELATACGVIIVVPAELVVIVVRGCWLGDVVAAVVITTFEMLFDEDCDSITLATEMKKIKLNWIVDNVTQRERKMFNFVITFFWKSKLEISGDFHLENLNILKCNYSRKEPWRFESYWQKS